MMLASTTVLTAEQAPQNGCHQCLCPQGESLLPPASPVGSSRSASGSDPGFFQITDSALALGGVRFLCAPFKSRVCFLQPSGSPTSKPHCPSKPNVLVAYLTHAGPPGWGAQYGAWTPHS